MKRERLPNDEWIRTYQELADDTRSPGFPSREVFDLNLERWMDGYEDSHEGQTVRDFLRARLAATARLTSDPGPARIIRRGHDMNVDIGDLIRGLANQRAVFHSEADLQLALGWHINSQVYGAGVRLEKPFEVDGKRARIDIWLAGEEIAIELKYFTQELSACLNGELFDLREHAAADLARHGFLQDIQRLERIVGDENQPARSGLAVLLTNAPMLWLPPGRDTNDAAFRLHDGRHLTGRLQWLRDGSPTVEDELRIRGSYTMNWQTYSDLGYPNGKFRFLTASVR